MSELCKCERCLKKFNISEMFSTLTGYVCKDCCVSDEYVPCTRCGVYTLSIYQAEGQYYCVNCYRQYTVTCYNCNDRILIENARSTANEDRICQTCYDDDFFCCDNCDEIYPNNYYAGDGECERCQEGHIDNDNDLDGLYDHDYKPDPVLQYSKMEQDAKPATPWLIGFELEVECKDSRQEILDMVYKSGLKVYCKEDGSLSNGFEIVTHPMTLLKLKEDAPNWEKLLMALINAGCRSHKSQTCGLHYHVSKRPLSKIHEIKLALLVYNNVSFFEKLGRRGVNSFCLPKEIKPYTSLHEPGYSGRYEMINYCNRNTDEFRFPKGTLKFSTFMAMFELIHALVLFVTTSEKNTVYFTQEKIKLEFIEFCKTDKNYSFLPKYLKERGY